MTSFSPAEMRVLTRSFKRMLASRRSIRDFADTHIPREIIENIVATAATAPSGANKQPWQFCLVGDPEVQAKIRAAAEKEEYENYHGRMSEEWLADLAKFGTDWRKPFLTTAPWLIVVFKKPYDLDADGNRHKNYYVNESVGIACGFLIAAIHNAGLVTLTHTPSPMNFLERLLKRPPNERAYLLLPVGRPAEGATVPDIQRKGLEEVTTWHYPIRSDVKIYLSAMSAHPSFLEIVGPVQSTRKMTFEEFEAFAFANPELVMELEFDGTVSIMSPVAPISGNRENQISADLVFYERKTGGMSFSSSTGFKLPNGSVKSPDASFIIAERLVGYDEEKLRKFAPIVPDFITEVLSPSDTLEELEDKVRNTWIANGVRLAWLVDVDADKLWVYRADHSVELVSPLDRIITGEDVLPGFEFDLRVLR